MENCGGTKVFYGAHRCNVSAYCQQSVLSLSFISFGDFTKVALNINRIKITIYIFFVVTIRGDLGCNRNPNLHL